MGNQACQFADLRRQRVSADKQSAHEHKGIVKDNIDQQRRASASLVWGKQQDVPKVG